MAFCLLGMHRKTWLKTTVKETGVFRFTCGAVAQGLTFYQTFAGHGFEALFLTFRIVGHL